MCAKARAETYEPKITGVAGNGCFEGLLQSEEHRRTAHVAVVPQHQSARLKQMRREDRLERLQYIATSGVGHDAGHGPRAALRPQPGDGIRCQLGHGAVQEITQLAVALLKTEFIPVGG